MEFISGVGELLEKVDTVKIERYGSSVISNRFFPSRQLNGEKRYPLRIKIDGDVPYVSIGDKYVLGERVAIYRRQRLIGHDFWAGKFSESPNPLPKNTKDLDPLFLFLY